MGAVHSGHLSLIERSKSENPFTVMSLFVNPTQFGENEDFDAYPRTLERDQMLAEESGVDLLWTPSREDIYTENFSTFIEETKISQHLCGAHRPKHFRGVCTVVFRLLGVVEPDRIYLGKKDAQQLRVIEKMAEDLALGVKVVGCPTVREEDGLAMSSRNRHLSPKEREIAPALHVALAKAEKAFQQGEKESAALIAVAKKHLANYPEITVQYLELRDWRDFNAPGHIDAPAIVAAAVFLGKTRLIDNLFLASEEFRT